MLPEPPSHDNQPTQASQCWRASLLLRNAGTAPSNFAVTQFRSFVTPRKLISTQRGKVWLRGRDCWLEPHGTSLDYLNPLWSAFPGEGIVCSLHALHHLSLREEVLLCLFRPPFSILLNLTRACAQIRMRTHVCKSTHFSVTHILFPSFSAPLLFFSPSIFPLTSTHTNSFSSRTSISRHIIWIRLWVAVASQGLSPQSPSSRSPF